MRTFIAAVLSLLLCGCFSSEPNKAAEELAIREAAIRYQIARDASAQTRTMVIYFLSIYSAEGQESDPTESFMKRFAKNKISIRKVSECSKSFEKGVSEKISGELGVILGTGPVRWTTETEAEIYVTESTGNLGGAGENFNLKKINGEWKVVRAELQWIS